MLTTSTHTVPTSTCTMPTSTRTVPSYTEPRKTVQSTAVKARTQPVVPPSHEEKISKYIILIVRRVVTSQSIVLLAKKFPTRVMFVILLKNESILLYCNLLSLRKFPLCNQRLLHQNLNRSNFK